MSLEATIWAWERVRSLEARSALVLLALADYIRPEGRTCFPGQQTLATRTGQSERTVRRAIGDLEARDLIQRRRRMRTEGGRNSDEYELYGPAFVGPEGSPDNLTGSGQPDNLAKKGLEANGARGYRPPKGALPAKGAPESLREPLSSESPRKRAREKNSKRGRSSVSRPLGDAIAEMRSAGLDPMLGEDDAK